MSTCDASRYDAIAASLRQTLEYLLEDATTWDLFALVEVLARHAGDKARQEQATREIGPQMQTGQPAEMPAALRQQLAEMERQNALLWAHAQANCPPAQARQKG